jgi:hypothetical protein
MRLWDVDVYARFLKCNNVEAVVQHTPNFGHFIGVVGGKYQSVGHGRFFKWQKYF